MSNVCALMLFAAASSATDEYKHTPFDPDPGHTWNRIHEFFFIRVGEHGNRYTAEELDPPLAFRTLYPLTEPGHERIVARLDEFIESNASTHITDPLKRAIFQRDMWAVFDWTTEQYRIGDSRQPHPESRNALQTRLATIIKQIALTREEIAALPDNYQIAAQSGQFPSAYDPANPEAAFLPPGLTVPAEPWRLISAHAGGARTARTSLALVATEHTQASMGRSVFYVYGQFPNDPSYLKRLQSFPTPWAPRESDGMFLLSPDLPQFPAETQFVLLRKTLLIDDGGALVVSPLTESVQIRVYKTEPSNKEFWTIREFSQDVYEFTLDRDALFNGERGGLRLVTNDDLTLTTPPFSFWPNGLGDPIEAGISFKKKKIPPLQTCKVCHSGAGIHSVRSFHVANRRPPTLLTTEDQKSEAERTINWKEQHYSWGLLQGLWNAL